MKIANHLKKLFSGEASNEEETSSLVPKQPQGPETSFGEKLAKVSRCLGFSKQKQDSVHFQGAWLFRPQYFQPIHVLRRFFAHVSEALESLPDVPQFWDAGVERSSSIVVVDMDLGESSGSLQPTIGSLLDDDIPTSLQPALQPIRLLGLPPTQALCFANCTYCKDHIVPHPIVDVDLGESNGSLRIVTLSLANQSHSDDDNPVYFPIRPQSDRVQSCGSSHHKNEPLSDSQEKTVCFAGISRQEDAKSHPHLLVDLGDSMTQSLYESAQSTMSDMELEEEDYSFENLKLEFMSQSLPLPSTEYTPHRFEEQLPPSHSIEECADRGCHAVLSYWQRWYWRLKETGFIN